MVDHLDTNGSVFVHSDGELKHYTEVHIINTLFESSGLHLATLTANSSFLFNFHIDASVTDCLMFKAQLVLLVAHLLPLLLLLLNGNCDVLPYSVNHFDSLPNFIAGLFFRVPYSKLLSQQFAQGSKPLPVILY
ncbi:hypothetical protein FOXG_18536 [Fusarium oxysporum f. sp. lycopersici 4287]|uniref:Uncharacterized protein n=2 Tax=Fusarium oxysporum TaxID=5507 RepID=A0A0J9UJM3_FUSO4|nr:hypothetical protein FOXG_18536 [Fusarium oxysporum f. sp. lycopersici 4287]EXK30928.1 hypothetical protein FOMG_12762 [Fusarium oxysporum f. sp. melonis 26406]KNA99389.1 hypothetical protein FOXG_18536 [Fusarium oxysporum f. sp. lycopersici 4287]